MTHSQTTGGAPAESDAHSLSVGPNGPLLLHDVHLVETLAHFNRANVPERRPHAKGAGAFGRFTVTQDVSRWTKAAVFAPGTETKTLLRFSTVAGELGSPDTWRDVRGFSLRFYTTEGNYDLVGNNTPIFFVRDPMKFPHFIRSQKRLPDSGLRDATMQWDFWTLSPESAHQVTYLMGDRGLPRTWRHMNGYGSHTYQWVNEAGERFWVKYHFHTQQGMEFLTNDEAEAVAGGDADYHRRDLFDAIKRGELPKWTMSVQVMGYEEAKTYRINPFDLTKVWPHEDFPLHEVGVLELNENPTNFFAQIEQAAFAPSNIVPGIGYSPDKMLLGRVFAYADAHRARVGTNFHQLPVNQPLGVEGGIEGANHWMFEGNMTYHHSGDQPVYAPNSFGRSYSEWQGEVAEGWESDGAMVRAAYTLREDDDDFSQPGKLVREVFDDAARDRLVETLTGQLKAITDEGVADRFMWYWTSIDPGVASRVQANVQG
ncbi:catalase [Propioniciclava soli]|uniref:Catalase n=1 Tax=Propioniciclava soli TaxID=2775081 RepID=A0ABZ3CA76_9ACTN|nr:catalase [Propioniciclava soli]